ncbi:spore coat protein [Bacillus songklensis]|uniref:Spore coat protein n=1 Tax=Bacillus songklensis TaxID=1069116 RepID=A0ABV8B779_9BACI
MKRPDHLAWHETLELHELVAFQSGVVKKLKKSIKDISCPTLKALYRTAIQSGEKNLKELLKFIPYAPEVSETYREDERAFFAGDLLGASKTAVRNYAAAITETATPSLRAVFVRHLNKAIELHYQVFEYMYQKSYYPAYELEKLLQNDMKMARSAIDMPY